MSPVPDSLYLPAPHAVQAAAALPTSGAAGAAAYRPAAQPRQPPYSEHAEAPTAGLVAVATKTMPFTALLLAPTATQFVLPASVMM